MLLKIRCAGSDVTIGAPGAAAIGRAPPTSTKVDLSIWRHHDFYRDTLLIYRMAIAVEKSRVARPRDSTAQQGQNRTSTPVAVCNLGAIQ
jgi:hypothetical protein